MQITNRQHIDYFKVFKIFDVKKLEKEGQVKLVQDKIVGRKVLSVQGNVSTQNFITFDSNQVSKSQPNLSFSQRYLYIIGWMEVGKNFCFQLQVNLNVKIYKIIFSTVYKQQKLTIQGILQFPLLELKSSKWTILVIDLYELCQRISKDEEIRVNFKLVKVQIRANSKIKNIYLSDNLYDPYTLPKDIQLPVKNSEDFYSKYNYVIVGDKSLSKNKEKVRSVCKDKVQTNNQISQKSKQKDKIEQSRKGLTNSIKFPTKSINKVLKKPKIQNQEEQRSKMEITYEQQNVIPIKNSLPRPQVTINCKLVALEGRTLIKNGVISLQGFIIYPSIFAVHKAIRCISLHKQFAYMVAVGYIDGSICIWDIIRHKCLSYLKTELVQLKKIEITGSGEKEKIFIVGNDRIKRQTILIINRTDILFRQISNYSIHDFLICNVPTKDDQNQQVMVSYGYENIRLWKLNPRNNIITGVGLYLGKMNSKVTYTSACKLTQNVILIVDNYGYLTRISAQLQKMQEIKKISQNGLDIIMNIKEMKNIMICESGGNIKLLSYDLIVLEQFQFGSRVREMSYVYESRSASVILSIDHYNNCTAEYNIQQSKYNYITRQHTQPIVALSYNLKINKIVTGSMDNTIRIWSMFCSSKRTGNSNRSTLNNKSDGNKEDAMIKYNQLEYQIKQQYEFLINNGEQILTVSTDQNIYCYVGFKGAILRKIDLIKYQIIQQKTFVFKSEMVNTDSTSIEYCINMIEISKNNKNLLLSISQLTQRTVKNLYVLLCDSDLNILYKYNAPNNYRYGYDNNQVLVGFSSTHKKIHICWVYGSINRIQIYSLTQNLNTICSQFYIQCSPIEIKLSDQCVYVTGANNNHGVYEIYGQDGSLIRAINLEMGAKSPQNKSRNRTDKKINRYQERINFPLIAHSNAKQQLQLQVLQSSALMIPTRQYIDMPEGVQNINICSQSSNGSNGLIVCSGRRSYALYAVMYEINNVEQIYSKIHLSTGDREKLEVYNTAKYYNNKINKMTNIDQQPSQQLECAQSKLINFQQKDINDGRTSRQLISCQNTNNNTKQRYKNNIHINKTISSQNMILSKIQQLNQQHNSSFVSQSALIIHPLYQESSLIDQKYKKHLYPQPYIHQQYKPKSYQQQQYNSNISHNTQTLDIMYGWHSSYNYAHIYTPKTVQFSQLIWNPILQCALFLSHRNLILHYFKQPIHQKIVRLPLYPNFILSLGSIKKYIFVAFGNQFRMYNDELVLIRSFTAFGDQVISLCMSNCQGYLVVLSSSKNKSFLQVIDILSSNTLCSTYLSKPTQKATLISNPFTNTLEFLLYSTTQAHFYRLTSILTLQTQQLQGVAQLINSTKMGDIICARYFKLQNQELILFGMSDGSIVLVDGRANSILMACRSVSKSGIVDIIVQQYKQNQDQNYSGVVILITESNIIQKYNITQMSLKGIIQAFETHNNSTLLTTDSQITMCSKLQRISIGSYAMLLTTKLGLLWLVDVSDEQTIKILSVHSQSLFHNNENFITKCILSEGEIKENLSDFKVITGSFDGTVKETSLFNLQQTVEIYKPRRVVNDLIIANEMILVAFGVEIYFYVMKKYQSNEWKFIGSLDIASAQGKSVNDKSSTTVNSISSSFYGMDNIKMKNVPFSDNYIVLTSTSIFLLYHQRLLSEQTNKLKLQIKEICNNLDNGIDLDVLGYNYIMVREKTKISVWMRKDKRGQMPLQQLTKIEEVAYYMIDVYHIQASCANFMINSYKKYSERHTQKQLIICLKSHPIIQIRDIQQHSILKQVQIGINSMIKAIKISQDNNYIVGDGQGIVWLIKQNGLTLNKAKVFDSEVRGIIQIENRSQCGSKVIAYGSNVALINL